MFHRETRTTESKLDMYFQVIKEEQLICEGIENILNLET